MAAGDRDAKRAKADPALVQISAPKVLLLDCASIRALTP